MTSDQPILFIFSGLPGSGKSTLAQWLVRRLGCGYLRIDTIEQGLRDLCALDVRDEGYRLAYRLAADQLHLGVSVVADACNPVEVTRRAWERVAQEAGARAVNIEIVCPDAREHRRRVETRGPTVPGLRPPTWHEVEQREYHDWTVDRIMIDTSCSVADGAAALMAALRRVNAWPLLD